MKTYFLSGVVLGKTWGGGFGAYKSHELQAQTKKELINQAKKDLKSGVLDSGMGFEYLKGARLDIQEIETVKIKDKEYQRAEHMTELIGDLTEKEQDFLLSGYEYIIP